MFWGLRHYHLQDEICGKMILLFLRLFSIRATYLAFTLFMIFIAFTPYLSHSSKSYSRHATNRKRVQLLLCISRDICTTYPAAWDPFKSELLERVGLYLWWYMESRRYSGWRGVARYHTVTVFLPAITIQSRVFADSIHIHSPQFIPSYCYYYYHLLLMSEWSSDGIEFFCSTACLPMYSEA